MFIALSKEIEVVRDNLLSFHAFGPVAYVNHQKSTVMSTLAKTDIAALLKVVFLVKFRTTTRNTS